MSHALGDFLLWVHKSPRDPRSLHPVEWPPLGTAAPVRQQRLAPGIDLWWRGSPLRELNGDLGGIALVNAPTHAAMPGSDPVLQTWREQRRANPEAAFGRFGYLLWDTGTRHVAAFTDAFRTHPLHFYASADEFICATDLRLLLATGVVAREVDARSIYHYLNFSYVPAPCSAVRGAAKLPAGSLIEWRPGGASQRKWWDARYPEDRVASEQVLVPELREQIVAAVRRHRPAASTKWGAFLSGGTDSSSIAGILSREPGIGTVDTFSIGFGESEFDELTYARIAAAYYKLNSNTRDVGERDAVDAIPLLVSAYDEPFGNSSAIPTYYCAKLGREHGRDVLVAGDGGDEIFGGNERYRKDKIFEWYHRAPAPLRGLGSLAARALAGVDSRFANRVKNFIYRGSLPNPDRFYTDDSFASEHFEGLLSADFRAQVGRDDSLDHQRALYRDAGAGCNLHKLMYLDIKMTIADNDIVKVARATRLAGVDVAFPYLDRGLVEYTGRLPCRYKVKGLQKRYLFKRAMETVLPREILQKKKHGFGLPVSVWLRGNGPFREMVNDVLMAPRAMARGYFQKDYISGLLERHRRGAWDHSAEIYILLMLELWHREYMDAHD